MKRVVQLIVENFDKHVQEKLRLIISEEVDQRCDFKTKEIFDSLEYQIRQLDQKNKRLESMIYERLGENTNISHRKL